MGIERSFGRKTRGPRRTGQRERRARVLLVLGGVRTEADYFNWVKKSLATAGLDIELECQGWDPSSLMVHAIELKEQDRKRAKKERDLANVYDAVWVVTDVDEFASHITELKNNPASGVSLAVTNPCFEAWLNMHVDPSAAPVDRFQAQSKARELGVVERENPKRIVISAIEGRFSEASDAADRLTSRHEGNGTEFPHDSPSTSVNQIVNFLLARARASTPNSSINL